MVRCPCMMLQSCANLLTRWYIKRPRVTPPFMEWAMTADSASFTLHPAEIWTLTYFSHLELGYHRIAKRLQDSRCPLWSYLLLSQNDLWMPYIYNSWNIGNWMTVMYHGRKTNPTGNINNDLPERRQTVTSGRNSADCWNLSRENILTRLCRALTATLEQTTPVFAVMRTVKDDFHAKLSPWESGSSLLNKRWENMNSLSPSRG